MDGLAVLTSPSRWRRLQSSESFLRTCPLALRLAPGVALRWIDRLQPPPSMSDNWQSIEGVVWKPNRHPGLRGYGMSVNLQLVDPLDPSSHRKDTVPAVGEANVRLDVQRSPSL